ncbi:MAG: molybdopterin-guanine dinucleotide biosynthesis protein B [Desulfobacteraceae bacterium]|nr:MAG: molybdopterin-guanine dinucleotide biosynthesis protein B [Desulfobacteraceae bacterium]
MTLHPVEPRTGPAIMLIVGFANSGKTLLMTRLIEILSQRGLRVGAVKHHGHVVANSDRPNFEPDFEMDQPGKDTWKYRQAGAKTAVISSRFGIGMVKNVDHDHEIPELMELMPDMDIVLAEGYKRADHPKIEVFRPENGKPPACRYDRNLIAVVSDTPLEWDVPQFGIEAVSDLADFMLHKLNITV